MNVWVGVSQLEHDLQHLFVSLKWCGISRLDQSSAASSPSFLDDVNPEIEREIFAGLDPHVRAHFVVIAL